MKIFLCFLLLFLVSCTASAPDSETGASKTASSTTDVIDGYINTLETSVSDAREVAETVSAQQRELQEQLENTQ